ATVAPAILATALAAAFTRGSVVAATGFLRATVAAGIASARATLARGLVAGGGGAGTIVRVGRRNRGGVASGGLLLGLGGRRFRTEERRDDLFKHNRKRTSVPVSRPMATVDMRGDSPARRSRKRCLTPTGTRTALDS